MGCVKGLSGIWASQELLEVVGNNLANISTPGYKSESVNFQEAFYLTLSGGSPPGETRGGRNPVQKGLGVMTAGISRDFSQGPIKRTGRATDLAIGGRGFFILSDGRKFYFTRNGRFSLDQEGRLVREGTNLYLIGWQSDELGSIDVTGSVSPRSVLKIPLGRVYPGRMTTSVEIEGVLDPRLEAGERESCSFYVYDRLGAEHLLEVEFEKVSDGEWAWSLKDGGEGRQIASGTLYFDESGSPTNPSATVTVELRQGDSQEMQLDFSLVRQVAGDPRVSLRQQDGTPPGVMEDFSIENDGTIIGSLTNGRKVTVGRVALATFVNGEGLLAEEGGFFSETPNSGPPQVRAPGEGAGDIVAGALEMSNTDIVQEITKLMEAHHMFQANLRLISTFDEMVRGALNLRR